MGFVWDGFTEAALFSDFSSSVFSVKGLRDAFGAGALVDFLLSGPWSLLQSTGTSKGFVSFPADSLSLRFTSLTFTETSELFSASFFPVTRDSKADFMFSCFLISFEASEIIGVILSSKSPLSSLYDGKVTALKDSSEEDSGGPLSRDSLPGSLLEMEVRFS